MTQVLLRMNVLPWDERVATRYGELCTALETQGINRSDFDIDRRPRCSGGCNPGQP